MTNGLFIGGFMKSVDQIRREAMLHLEQEAGGPTPASIRAGMSYSQWANLRSGARDSKTGKVRGMRADTARQIEIAFGKPEGWLDHYDLVELGPPEISDTEPGPEIRGRVPLISWVQAGAWNQAADPYHPGEAEDWLPCAGQHGPRTYALRVRGDSMTAPHGRSYPEGSIIFVDPDRRSPTNGARVIAKLSGTDEVTFKVIVNDAGRTWLKPLNPQHPPLLDEFKVIGTIIGTWVPE